MDKLYMEHLNQEKHDVNFKSTKTLEVVNAAIQDDIASEYLYCRTISNGYGDLHIVIILRTRIQYKVKRR